MVHREASRGLSAWHGQPCCTFLWSAVLGEMDSSTNCARSLRDSVHVYPAGELHNNIRMTWGKAILPWSPDPDTAIKRTVFLNHKYALDGCDPCSYSGILWCYGQFDKPMGQEKTPIYGKLRKRDTSVVGNKLDVATYRTLAIEADSAEIAGKPAQKAISDFFAPRH